MNKTIFKDKNELVDKWYLIDAKNQKLGRMSSIIAHTLIGKNSYDYAASLNLRHHVIVINAKKISVTGNKETDKIYRNHSGRPGGMKIETFKQLNSRIPCKIIEKSVKGMLPKGPLGRKLFTQLKVYEFDSHPHIAQKPEIIDILL